MTKYINLRIAATDQLAACAALTAAGVWHRADDITKAEEAVLKLLAKGMSDKEIASSMGRSISTVKGQMNSMFNKLGVNNRVQAALYAVRVGLAEVEA